MKKEPTIDKAFNNQEIKPTRQHSNIHYLKHSEL
ncbi:BnaCnng76510D [Brassica napus]|uniref:(rape) hypothetical protein n=1 Tax=Brassica napus TaxID=3708 RepID=A0A078K2T9_BRANA|nr:unnamed protein product [Brassica napus]CDY72217.1 BnaCnng76510D [Brassica napus]